MRYRSDAQKTIYQKIAPWMSAAFGEQVQKRRNVPILGGYRGSALIEIGVFPFGDDDATITFRAQVARGAALDEELLFFLMRQNDEMRFGAFALDKANGIVFSYTMVGSACEREAFMGALRAVGEVADRFDDEIVRRWGGVRALDS